MTNKLLSAGLRMQMSCCIFATQVMDVKRNATVCSLDGLKSSQLQIASQWKQQMLLLKGKASMLQLLSRTRTPCSKPL